MLYILGIIYLSKAALDVLCTDFLTVIVTVLILLRYIQPTSNHSTIYSHGWAVCAYMCMCTSVSVECICVCVLLPFNYSVIHTYSNYFVPYLAENTVLCVGHFSVQFNLQPNVIPKAAQLDVAM